MKKSFICSLVCPNGIIGGKLTIESDEILYKTNKLTIEKDYKNIRLQIEKISSISWKRIIFPIAIVNLDGKQYKFLMFNKKGFIKTYNQLQKI